MAQINGPDFSKFIATAQTKPKSREWGGRCRSWCSSVLLAAAASSTTGAIAAAAGDCLRMFRIPAGHKVLGGRAYWSALGASTTVYVGDGLDCDRMMTVADGSIISTLQLGATPFPGGCGTFNNVSASFQSGSNTPDTGPGYLFTCDTDIIVAFGYGGAPVGVLTLEMETVIY